MQDFHCLLLSFLKVSPVLTFHVKPKLPLEACLTFFFLLSIAFFFRRAALLRRSDWVEDGIKILSRSTKRIDLQIAQLMRLQYIAEEAFWSIGIGTTDNPFANFPDKRTLLVLKSFLTRVFQWRQNLPEDLKTPTLELQYHCIVISLYEPWLYNYHSIGDFQPPYAIRAHPVVTGRTANSTSSMHDLPFVDVANAHAECSEHAKAAIRVFSNAPTPFLRMIPGSLFTRLSYAFVILIKLFVSTRVPNSAEALVCDTKGGRPPHRELFPQVISKLEEAIGGSPLSHKMCATFVVVMKKLSEWCEVHLENTEWEDDENDVIEPMRDMGLGMNDGEDGKDGSPHDGSFSPAASTGRASIDGRASFDQTSPIIDQRRSMDGLGFHNGASITEVSAGIGHGIGGSVASRSGMNNAQGGQQGSGNGIPNQLNHAMTWPSQWEQPPDAWLFLSADGSDATLNDPYGTGMDFQFLNHQGFNQQGQQRM